MFFFIVVFFVFFWLSFLLNRRLFSFNIEILLLLASVIFTILLFRFLSRLFSWLWLGICEAIFLLLIKFADKLIRWQRQSTFQLLISLFLNLLSMLQLLNQLCLQFFHLEYFLFFSQSDFLFFLDPILMHLSEVLYLLLFVLLDSKLSKLPFSPNLLVTKPVFLDLLLLLSVFLLYDFLLLVFDLFPLVILFLQCLISNIGHVALLLSP